MRNHCTAKARQVPGFFCALEIPTGHLACIAAIVASHPSAGSDLRVRPTLPARRVVKRPPGSLSRVAFEMNCRRAPVLFITWRSNERAGFMFLGCPSISYDRRPRRGWRDGWSDAK